MRTFEFRGKTYQEVRTQDLKAGDEVFHVSWLSSPSLMDMIISNRSNYTIKENSGQSIKATETRYNDGHVYDWDYSTFGDNWFIEGIKMMEYSPDQQGEDDDSI